MRVINEDIAGLHYIAWAAIKNSTVKPSNELKTVLRITGMILDQHIAEEHKKPIGQSIKDYLKI